MHLKAFNSEMFALFLSPSMFSFKPSFLIPPTAILPTSHFVYKYITLAESEF